MSEALNVLIAEDEHVILMGLKASLKGLGHNIIGTAHDGKEAVNLALETEPDLILMDINLPQIDGIEAIKKINKHIIVPTIIISGYHDEELIKRAKEAGVFAYLIKPINERELKAEIEICMAKFGEFQFLQKEYENVKDALEARKYIEKAKGILMDRNNMKEPQAMKALQEKSRNNNKKLINVAKQIIQADEVLKVD